MRVLISTLIILFGATLAHGSIPIPFAGKLSVDRFNFSGNARFSFEVLDVNGTALWQNGEDAKDMIRVPVNRGHYLVLLGGQGMNSLPSNLFHQNITLSLRVKVDLDDGQGVHLLSPDTKIDTSPRALAVEIAKLADRATIADGARLGSISENNFSPAIFSQFAHFFDPQIDDFSIDGMTPKFSTAGTSVPVRLGETLTLNAPSTPGRNLRYSWERNGSPIEGAEQPMLQILADEAVYTVSASNALGSSRARFETYGVYQIESKILDVWSSTYFIDTHRKLWGLGANFHGKIGLENTDASLDPVFIADDVKSVSSNENFAVFVKTDGTLWGIGRNDRGQLGDGSTSSHRIPVKITEGETLYAVAGQDHTLFVKLDGSLWGMGSNEYGQLGRDADASQIVPFEIYESGVVTVSAGEGFSFVLMKSGKLKSFGRNDYGQLGNATKSDSKEIHLTFKNNVKDVSCGNLHTIILLDDGSVWTMGENQRGQLGNGKFDNSAQPVKIIDSGVIKIDAGYRNSYFLKKNGELWGMGANRDGQLGAVPSETMDGRSNIPLKIASGVTDFSSGGWSLIFTQGDEKLFGLGYTGWAQFGINEPYIQHTSQEIDLSGVERIETNYNSNAIWLKNGEFWLSGSNGGSKLMLGHDTSKISHFVKSKFNNPRSYFGGSDHALLVDANGSMWAVGDNPDGRLGITSQTRSLHPIKVVSGEVVKGSSRSQTLFIKEDGSLWGMGRNQHGQLGNGNYSDQNTPIKIVDSNVIQVVTGSELTMFLKSDGSVWTMGSNRHGRLGIGKTDGWAQGSFATRNVPTKVFDKGITSLAASRNACYLLSSDGSIWAFGLKEYGQIGENKVSDRHFPIQIVMSGVLEISAFGDHMVFVKDDGSLWGMGRNHRGQLGNNQFSEITYPMMIMNSNVKSARAGVEHTLVLKQDGTIFSLGSNIDGQLATGRTIWTEKPFLITEDLGTQLVE